MTDRRDAKSGNAKGGFSRRSFLAGVGAGAVGAATSRAFADGEGEKAAVLAEGERTQIRLRVNGREHDVLVESRWSLLHVLREHLELTGSKEGCARGECGACTVLIDGVPRYACLTLAVEAEGHAIETVEGLMDGEALGDVQRAFVEEDAFQCGYCTSGQIMAVEGLLRKDDDPDPDAVRRATSGNLCRCGAYPHITNAALKAATLRKGGR